MACIDIRYYPLTPLLLLLRPTAGCVMTRRATTGLTATPSARWRACCVARGSLWAAPAPTAGRAWLATTAASATCLTTSRGATSTTAPSATSAGGLLACYVRACYVWHCNVHKVHSEHVCAAGCALVLLLVADVKETGRGIRFVMRLPPV
jgi:hypothetical protein